MRQFFFALSVFALGLVSGCGGGAPAAPAAIAWRQGDVEEAFAEAAESGRPVLLYWGAVWCPPCNRLKATLFQDASFVAQTLDFVPVYLDGDSHGAQLWGDTFAIQGYPTLIILRPDRTEITRLSGGGDPDEIVRALAASRSAQGSVAELIARAQSQPRRLSEADWALIGEFDWEADGGRVVAAAERAGVLQRLAAAAPRPALARRFELLALAGIEDGQATAQDAARARTVLEAVLADAGEVRANREVLTYNGASLTALAAPDARASVQSALVAALDRLYAEADLPISDRLVAVLAEIEIARLNHGEDEPLPAALVDKVRERARWADETAQTPFERQSAVYIAAGLLEEAGDADGAERLLLAELDRSATPFYYMPILARLAEQRGDRARALEWLRRGYETSVGPASRVQWGVNYAVGVTRLTPGDAGAVEQAAVQIIDELASPDSYHQRTRGRFGRLETALQAWSAANGGEEVLVRLHARMADVCPRAQADAAARQACASWLGGAT